MPLGMAITWLGLGGIFIVGVVIASMVLPGPDTPALIQKLNPSNQAYQAGSKLAQKQGAEGKGDEKVAAKQEVDQKEGKKTVEGKKGAENNKKGDQKGGEQKGDKKNDEGKTGNQNKSKDNEPVGKPKGDVKENKGKPGEKKGEEPTKNGKNQEAPREASPAQKTLGTVTKIIGILLLLPVLVVILVVFLKAMGLQQGGWLDWINRLLGWFKPKDNSPLKGQYSDQGSGELKRIQRHFSDLENPFVTGEAASMKDNDLVLATSEAVLVWAEDLAPSFNHGLTFREVVGRLAKEKGMVSGIEELIPYQQSQQYYHLSGKTEACARICEKVWKVLEGASANHVDD